MHVRQLSPSHDMMTYLLRGSELGAEVCDGYDRVWAKEESSGDGQVKIKDADGAYRERDREREGGGGGINGAAASRVW